MHPGLFKSIRAFWGGQHKTPIFGIFMLNVNSAIWVDMNGSTESAEIHEHSTLDENLSETFS